jgi:hypothetical protein
VGRGVLIMPFKCILAAHPSSTQYTAAGVADEKPAAHKHSALDGSSICDVDEISPIKFELFMSDI